MGEEIAGRVWGKIFEDNKSYFIKALMIFIITVIFIVYALCSIEENCYKIIMSLCIAAIGILMEILFYNEIKLPCAKSKYYSAVLLIIDAESKEEYNSIKSKLADLFKKSLQGKDKKLFAVEYLKYEITDKYKILNDEETIKLLEKTNCDYLVNVNVKSEQLKDEKQYVVKIGMGYKHPAYIKPIEECFKKEFVILSKPTKKLDFLSKDKIQVLEVTANRMSLICQYIIGRGTYFNMNFKMAGILFDELYSDIKNINQDEYVIKTLKTVIPPICCDIHLRISDMHYTEFCKNKNYEDLDKMNFELEFANQYVNNTYEYHLSKSVYTFLKHRDIEMVKKELKACKEKRVKGTWEYSDAFICAYEEKSEMTIFNKYKKALKNDYNLMYLIEFIEDVLREDKINSLRFPLIILNLEVGNTSVAQEILGEYLENKESHILDSNVEEILKRKYKDVL